MKPTRKSISVRIEVWARLRSYCARTGEPVAALIERNVTRMLDAYNEPNMDRGELVAERRAKMIARKYRGVVML